MIVLACLSVLALTVFNFFGLLSPTFPKRPNFLPQESVICEGRIARMSEPRLLGTRLWMDDLACHDGKVMRVMPGMAQVTVMNGGSTSSPRTVGSVRPEPVEGLLYGDRVRFQSHLHTPHGYHNPGAIDWERKAVSDGIAWTGAVETPEWVMRVASGWDTPLRAIDRWRQVLAQQIDTIKDPEMRGSAAALLLGDAGLLPERFGDGLRYLGIIHLYVISGLHVAIVALLAYEILYWLLARRSRWALQYPLWRWSAAFALIAVWMYAGLVGFGVAVVRAAIMVSVYLVARILDRQHHVGAAIALAALLLIFQSPHVIFVPGFQLSFVAVIALVTVYPVMARVLRVTEIPWRALRWGAEGLLAALVATWATAPIVAYHFHQTPLLGLPANLIAGPYTTFILMPLGFLWTLVADIPSAASVMQTIWTTAATPLVRGITWATPISESTQWTFTPTVWEMMWWYSLLIPLSLWERARVRGWIAVWTIIGVTCISLRTYDHYRSHPLQLTFLDVGQGAAVLVEFPDHHTMLIDAGGVPNSDFDIGRWVVAPTLLARGITHVDDLLLTHPHPDHYGGLAYIAEHFHPTRFLTNGSMGEEGDLQWQAFMARMQNAGMSAEVVHHGMQMSRGSTQVTWRHPPSQGPDESLGKNNGSVVTDIRDGKFSALIVGDIQEEAEQQVLTDPELGFVDVLQVPHHASRTSSTLPFLRGVYPKVAVAQLGYENRYGFPHPEVAKRYEELKIPLCRNDRDGAVTIVVRHPSADSPTTRFSIQTDRPSETCSARSW